MKQRRRPAAPACGSSGSPERWTPAAGPPSDRSAAPPPGRGADYGVPRSWWPWLATAEALGAAGLLAGLAMPIIGVIAATGLVLYFAGAVVTVLRARAFSHVPYPLLYLAPSIAALTLGLTA
nr:DoxX family protein [Micromonospora purpureochromogenes]